MSCPGLELMTVILGDGTLRNGIQAAALAGDTA